MPRMENELHESLLLDLNPQSTRSLSKKSEVSSSADKSFAFGFANSMFQASGLRCGDSNWTAAAQKGSVPQPVLPIAHWDNFETDLNLMQSIGMNSYRVSIEWSHIEQQPGMFNEEVMTQYHRLIDDCLARGIQPMLTLCHFTEPLWFTELGGFLREENISYFVAFSKYVFSAFSPKVTLWCTINEPAVQAFMGCFLGKFPPHFTGNFEKTATLLKNLLKAHVDVYSELKQLPHGQEAMIGLVHNVLRFKPLYCCDPIAYFLTNLFNPITDELVMSFFQTGEFNYNIGCTNSVLYSDLRAPQANDFIGLNFYANPIVGPNLSNGYGATCRTDQEMGEMYLPLDPEGFAEAIDRVAQFGKPIYITETGVADSSDNLRQKLLPMYFEIIKAKIAEGCDIRGAMLWTMFDNYEWAEGHTKCFGFFDQERNPRPSVDVLKEIIKQWQINDRISTTDGDWKTISF